MSTTIKSTGLDFDSIKNNLKVFLAAQDEFADYNFESAALGNILDVLAYNTHYNALTANFALNESYLSTAQLRSSVVSLSENIGYVPDSKTSSRAVVRLEIDLNGVAGRPANVQLAAGVKFKSVINETTYVFQTNESIQATDDGNGRYEFLTSSGNNDIEVFEGKSIRKNFIVGPYSENAIYIIPDKDIDINTSIIKVFETSGATAFTTYSNIIAATVINENSRLYNLRESPNGQFELSFGDGVTLGQSPSAGNKVTVDYLRAVGSISNGGSLFTPESKVDVDGVDYTLSVTTITNSFGGGEKESKESIRKNAPFHYATQNRMVTSGDYSSLVLRNFSTLISDIQSWGGEDNLIPEFGVVFVSILFNDDVTNTVQDITKTSIVDLSNQLSVISFDLKFADPVITYIETGTFFQFNPRLTTLSLNSVKANVRSTISQYFDNNIGKFGQAFRRSNMLTEIDNVSPAVLSSRSNIKMQQRIIPTLLRQEDFNLKFPAALATPDDENFIITSSSFTFDNEICVIKNQLGSNKLQVVTLENVVIVDNIGSYSSTTNDINIVGFQPTSVLGGDNFIKISATPANQSAISPLRNDILRYDSNNSFVTSVLVDTV